MAMDSFSCPACGGKGAFEIASEAQDLSAMVGAVCGRCEHIVTEQEIKDWALKVATKLGKDAFKNVR